MPIFSQTIQELASNKMPQPYYRLIENTITTAQSSFFPTGAAPRSISAWINPTNYVSTDFANICGYGTDTTSDLFVMTFRSTGNLGLWGSSDNYDSGIAVELNKWQHVVVTYDGTNIIGYVDGVQGTTTAKSYTTTESAFVIGSGPTGGYQNFEGSISEVRVYNLALSHTEVKEIYGGASVPWKYKGASPTDHATGTAVACAGSFDSFTGTSADAYSASNSSSSGWMAASIALDQHFKKGETLGVEVNHTELSGANVSMIMFGYYSDGSGGGFSPNFGGFGSSAGRTTNYTTLTADTAGGGPYLWLKYLTTSSTSIAVNDVRVFKAGAVAEYDGSGIASDKWFDKSGNDLHGTVSGATVENAPSGDDGLVYEEGTWTPTFAGSGNAGQSATVQRHTARYTRVGRSVTATCYISWTNQGTYSGVVSITGLPFTVFETVYAVNIGYMEKIDFTTSRRLFGFANGAAIQFFEAVDDANPVALPISAFDDALNYFSFTVTYQAA